MLKNKIKISFVTFLAIMLISSLCFATDSIEATSDGTPMTIMEGQNDAIEDTATEDITTDDVAATENVQQETINKDVYKVDDVVEISELIDGNAFVIANELKVTGQIGGDLFVIANKVSIEGGAVYGNIFVLANEVNIAGMIYDLYCLTDTLTVGYDGVAYRDIRAGAQKVDFSGVVSRNMYLNAAEINLASDTYIGSNFEYSSATEANIEEGAQILGETTFTQTQQLATQSIGQKILGYVLTVINSLIYTLIIWLLLRVVSPKFIEKTGELISSRSILSLLVGLLVLILIPVIFVLTALVGESLVGVGLLLFGLYIIIIAVANVVAIIAISQFFKIKCNFLSKLKDQHQDLLYIIVFTIVLALISFIPYAGAIINFLVILLGMGILVMSLFSREKKEEVVSTTIEE